MRFVVYPLQHKNFKHTWEIIYGCYEKLSNIWNATGLFGETKWAKYFIALSTFHETEMGKWWLPRGWNRAKKNWEVSDLWSRKLNFKRFVQNMTLSKIFKIFFFCAYRCVWLEIKKTELYTKVGIKIKTIKL